MADVEKRYCEICEEHHWWCIKCGKYYGDVPPYSLNGVPQCPCDHESA